jgi:hypothetical protein
MKPQTFQAWIMWNDRVIASILRSTKGEKVDWEKLLDTHYQFQQQLMDEKKLCLQSQQKLMVL